MKRQLGLCGFLGLLLPVHLSAATAAVEVEVGGEYHFSLVNTDDGLNTDAAKIKKTEFGVKAAKLALRGKLTDQITWNVLAQLDKSPALERYWLTNKLTDQFDVSVGVQKIRTYGWHRKLTSSLTPVKGAYLAYNPYPDVMAVDFAYKIAGQSVAFTLAKDYSDQTAPSGSGATATTGCTASGAGCKSWNGRDVQKQPAFLLEWIGSFGELQPLVQASSYDLGKSSIVSAGLRYKNEILDSYIDYTLDTRVKKGLDPVTGDAREEKNKIGGLAVYGEFKAGALSPYLMFTTLDVADYTAEGAKEPKVNSSATKLDDNEQTIALGTYFENWGALYRPYVGIASVKGKYVKDATAGTEEDRTRLDLMAGLTGKF